MKYKVWDRFMVRTPALPITYLEEYTKSGRDIYTFISENEYLDEFFKKALLISSRSLYRSYINKPQNDKKYRNLCEGLLKYFIRATSRPTPYGYLANVGMGRFGEETNLIRDKIIIDIKVDTDWVNGFIRSLEDNSDYLKRLSLKFNDICFVSGDRIKNPYFSNRGNLKEGSQVIKENSIRYTNLIKLIKENAESFITYENIFNIIKDNYSEVDDSIIDSTIQNLVENEYLFTNLKLPAYCKDSLDHIISTIEPIDILKPVRMNLESLKKLFIEYKEKEDINIINRIYKTMEELNKSKNYLEFNTGYSYEKSNLNHKIKEDVESFVDTLSHISTEGSTYGSLDKFKSKFRATYGENVEVNLIEIIDENKFNGLSLIGNSFSPSDRENKIQKIIKDKIAYAMINNCDVYLNKSDFKSIDNSNIMPSKGFDLNVFLTESNSEEYSLTVGPNAGASKFGSMFQRFSDAFVPEDFRAYNNVYDEISNLIDNEYIEVELRECTVSGRSSNVVNNTKNYKYYIPIGLVGIEENSLSIDDILVGVDSNCIFYLKSKSLNKKLKFIKDNMLNTKRNSTLYQLLYDLSIFYDDIAINRVFALGNDGVFSPRIYIEDVIVSLKKWKFDEILLSKESFEKFKMDLIRLTSDYKIDSTVYLVENDNRLIIDLNSEEQLMLLYDSYKKSPDLKISELEPALLNDGVIRDESDNSYISELVFSIVLDESENKMIFNKESNLNILLQNDKRVYYPFEDGWIYLKLYGLENRTDEFLTRYIDEVIEKLENPKWFFIRYGDEEGSHIRLRIKLHSEDEAYRKLSIITRWISKLREINLVKKVVFDTYERETNRYGGIELIQQFEEFSYRSSKRVIEILRSKDIEGDAEKIYFKEIFNLLLNLSEDLEDCFKSIDRIETKNLFKTDYRSKKKEYMAMAEIILQGNYDELNNEQIFIKDLNDSLEEFKIILAKEINSNQITTTRSSILGAMGHMHCNRLTGNRDLEFKNSVIIRHTIHDILQKHRYLAKQLPVI